ncbi:hypothetical protein M9979_01070 [Sphingomonas sp. RP10(2022)]|uniref:Uncharacterized protein n=1 Tax=Sphingomonas liriopis TaxID=2949094 RepID=A0A9X2HPN5_9SPHN|nr:hypothetical protein [Sphingomonas liriopis]MCP3733477.1 hypothetical protein [Sphingomonas liriopis]
MHFELTNVGLRAQATAAGLVQLCIELRQTELLGDDAIERVKTAIADEIAIAVPRHVMTPQFRTDVESRLDKIFRGGEDVGSADRLGFDAPNV